jgi:hypothetical protein
MGFKLMLSILFLPIHRIVVIVWLALAARDLAQATIAFLLWKDEIANPCNFSAQENRGKNWDAK